MKEFDWEEAKKHHSPAMHQFLFEVHDQPISEDEFVKRRMEVPKISKAGNRVVRHKKTSRLIYRRLKERFGFFVGAK